MEKTALEETEFASYKDGNWDNFFTNQEELKIIEPINGSYPKYVFNNLICYLTKKGFFYFANLNDKRLSNKEDFPYIKEYCLNYEQKRKSKQFVKWDYEKDILRQELSDIYERDRLKFCDAETKRTIEEFIDKGKI